MDFSEQVDKILKELGDLLKEKNKSYGNSIFDPVHIFSKVDTNDAILIRIDDKLSRIKSGDQTLFKEDTLMDLVGYIILLMINQKKNQNEKLEWPEHGLSWLVEPIEDVVKRTMAKPCDVEGCGLKNPICDYHIDWEIGTR